MIVSLQLIELNPLTVTIIQWKLRDYLSTYLSIYLSTLCHCHPSCPLLLLVFSFSLPPTYYSVSICPWCPHSPPSPALSLGQQMETMAQFCLLFWVPRETCGFLDSAQLRSPYLIQNASAFSFHLKKKGSCGMHIF